MGKIYTCRPCYRINTGSLQTRIFVRFYSFCLLEWRIFLSSEFRNVSYLNQNDQNLMRTHTHMFSHALRHLQSNTTSLRLFVQITTGLYTLNPLKTINVVFFEKRIASHFRQQTSSTEKRHQRRMAVSVRCARSVSRRRPGHTRTHPSAGIYWRGKVKQLNIL